MASTFKYLIQKIENHPHRRALQSDLQQHRQCNPFSKRITRRDFCSWKHRTVNYSMWNPKHSAKYVCRTGTSASSTAHAGTSCEMERKRTRDTSSTLLTSFRFPIVTSRKGDSTATATGRRKGITSTSSRTRSRSKCKKGDFLGIHDRCIRDERFRKSMIELGRTEEVCREMDKLANEEQRTTLLRKENSVYRNNCWIRSNFVGSDTMPRKASSWFQRSIVYFATPQEPRGSGLLPKIKIGKALIHLGGTGKILGGILLLSIIATMNPALIDLGNLIDGDWANYSWNDHQHQPDAKLQ